MNRVKKVLILFFVTISFFSYGQNNQFEISKNLDIYATLMKNLSINYVDEIKAGELTEEAIDAMLKSLDPYTVYIPESEVEDFKFITTGEYGGIGALIQKRDDYVIISQPYKGFPADKAELRAGDKIIAINNKSMKGKETEDISNLMKGQPGTSFIITVEREGEKNSIDKTVTREKIQIAPVPYYGIVNGDIAYIKLRSFTQKSSQEVKKAFVELTEKHTLKGVILDLRDNGGGLLSEAVNIVNIFVPKGEVIVKTKGKLEEKNRDYITNKRVIDKNIPLTILVNQHSASASEIVAGAVQDLDRGVLIGKRTFGKGLVQNIIPISYNTKAKITVAKYYIPSGRCIQEVDYSKKNGNGDFDKVADSLITLYHTKNGRKVYDGKGVLPDIDIEHEVVSRIAFTLFIEHHVFDFSTKFFREHKEIASADEFEITDEIYDDFKLFLQGRDFEYTTDTEEQLKKLKESAEEEKYFAFIEEKFSQLEEELLKHKNNDIETFKEEIKRYIKLEILVRYYYSVGAIEGSLNSDKDVLKAIETIYNKEKYNSILSKK
ncbi:MAG: S41 family peptidase [Bacteroidota bacterium]|nr:S41 family peptidase [Bacteroidota bacterium]